MNATDIVVAGSLNVDLVARVALLPKPGETLRSQSFQRFPGGKGANQAVAAARLGARVSMVGSVGPDAEGRMLLDSLRGCAVDVEHVQIAEAATGTALITIDDAGENSIVIAPGANAAFSPADVERARPLIAGARMVLTQLEIPMEAVERLAAICEEEQTPLMLDPAPAVRLPAALMRRITWLSPNEGEARVLTGSNTLLDEEQTARQLLGMGCRNAVLKLGGRGAYVAAGDGASMRIPSFAVPVVDTTAAGDVFNGAFAARLVAGDPVEVSARYAAAAAAISVSREGAQPSMPTRDEVDRLLAGNWAVVSKQ